MQQSVVFYHLGHTGISTTREPDLDTSLAINGFKTLAACHTGQDGRQNARPAASMISGASLPSPPHRLSLSLSGQHNMDEVTLLQLRVMLIISLIRINITLGRLGKFVVASWSRKAKVN